MSATDTLVDLTERKTGNKMLIRADQIGFIQGKHQQADTSSVFVINHGLIEVSESWQTVRNRLKKAIAAMNGVVPVQELGRHLQLVPDVDSDEDAERPSEKAMRESDEAEDEEAEEDDEDQPEEEAKEQVAKPAKSKSKSKSKSARRKRRRK